jgi:hypothetical protein
VVLTQTRFGKCKKFLLQTDALCTRRHTFLNLCENNVYIVRIITERSGIEEMQLLVLVWKLSV